MFSVFSSLFAYSEIFHNGVMESKTVMDLLGCFDFRLLMKQDGTIMDSTVSVSIQLMLGCVDGGSPCRMSIIRYGNVTL